MSKIILKKSSVVNKVPLPGDLDYGELALNYADSKLFFKKADNSIATIGGASGTDNTKLPLAGGTMTGVITFAGAQTFPGTQLVGTTTLTTTAANQAVDTFDKTQYRTAKYFIQATAAGSVHITEILLTHDDNDVYVVEYGTILTGNSLITVSGSVNGTNVTLTITPVTAGTILDFSRTVLVARSLGLQGDLNTQSGSVDLNSSSGSEDLNV